MERTNEEEEEEGIGYVVVKKQGLNSSSSGGPARQLVDQMIRLGFFHDTTANSNRSSNQNDFDIYDDDLESYRKLRKDPPQSFATDLKCHIIPTTPTAMTDSNDQQKYYTRQGFIHEIVNILNSPEHNGRCSRDKLCTLMNVDTKYLKLEESSPSLMMIPIITMLPSSVQVLGPDLMSDLYWDRLRQEIQKQLLKHDGRLNLLDFATEHSIPMDMILSKVVVNHCIPNDHFRLIEGSKVLVSNEYIQNLKSEVIQYFMDLKEPTLVSTVCNGQNDHHSSWDQSLVVEWLVEECTTTKNMDGEIRYDPTNIAAAMYLPKDYTQRQRKEILDFVSVNGYMTADRSSTHHGMAFSQMKFFLQESYDSNIIVEISHDVLILDNMIQTVQVAIQEYTTTTTAASDDNNNPIDYIDLQDYLPSELIRDDIIKAILDRIGFISSPEQGVAVTVDDQALLVSRNVVREIHTKVLPSMIQDFAKTRAEELFTHSADGGDGDENYHDGIDAPNNKSAATGRKKGRSKKSSRKEKNSRKNAGTDDKPQVSAGGAVPPLLRVAGVVLKEYPNIFMNDTIEEDLLNHAETINWDDEDNSEIALIEFCKIAIYTKDFRSKCDQAVIAELQRLHSAKQSKATVSRKDEAAKIRSVEHGFEEAFIALCYIIQAQAKFISLASNSDVFDEGSLQILRDEFLRGCCADLTSRLTQYCMFQNEQDDNIFTYKHADESEQTNGDDENEEEGFHESGSLPDFCAVVDIASRYWQKKSYLSCPPPREPLPVLRESLSGNSGVVLARQWILCGGECYRGGVRTEDDGTSSYTRPANMDGFLSHVQENCLNLAGIPFKKLDKKSEKQFLFRRRQSLTQMLQVSFDPETVLELTIMILFQQVKQVVVSGSLLRSAIFQMLMQERKITDPVSAAMKTLNEGIDNGQAIGENVITAVKECGLCRDIGKHEVKGLP